MSPTTRGLILVVICAGFEGAAQIAWKVSSQATHHAGRWIALGVAFYLAEIALYSGALTLIDVSVAFAMGSLSFIAVALMSRVLLKEQLTPPRLLGLVFILCGVALMGGQA